MKNKLFILGWDNALISDVVENKVHPSYLAMLEKTDPLLAARWTLEDTMRMQGEQPEKIWESFAQLQGSEKARLAREIFYQTYQSLPIPPLTDNALHFLRQLNVCRYVVAVVSNKTQQILEDEIRTHKLGDLIDFAIGTTQATNPTANGGNRYSNSRCQLLQSAVECYPDAEEVIVIANNGYAEPAYTLGVSRYEEASAPVFDWLADELKKEMQPSACGLITSSDWREDSL